MLVDINSNETLFYPFIVSVNRCGVTCKIIDDPYSYVPNKVQNMNVRVFNSMLGVKKTSVDKTEMCAIQSKNGIIMNVGDSVEN